MALTTSEKSNLLFKKHLGYANTREQRAFFEEAIKSSFIVQPSQLWMYGDRIPDGTDKTGGADAIQKLKALANGEYIYHFKNEAEDKLPLVKRFVKLPLTAIDVGTDNAFLIADEHGEQLKDIIPFNYAEEIYNYELYTNNDERIPFGVGDWVVDTYSGVVTFYGELPPNVDHEHPPKLSFYQYVGGNGFRQDTYGFDGAILPLDNVEIRSGKAAFIMQNTSTSLFKQIVDKANEILPEGAPYTFVETFGWDGNNTNEGIALAFEKIIPLTYMVSNDPIKGYDQAAESEIGTLLSGKKAVYTSANYEIVFASQKLKVGDTYKINIENKKATGSFEGTAQALVDLTTNEWNLYKVWLTDKAFVVLRVLNHVDEEITLTVDTVENTKEVSCLLLYWSIKDKQYQPFLPKEDYLAQLGFPVVTINGRLPPSVQLGTAALATFQDTITPDYYGPRTFTVTIARDTGTDIKSADFIVKNTPGWYLDDILSQIAVKYPHFMGTIFLRAGTYKVANELNLRHFNNAIITGEGHSTIINVDTKDVNYVNDGIFEINHIKLKGVNNISVISDGNVFLSDVEIDGNLTFNIKEHGHLFIKNISAKDLNISGDDTDIVNVDIRGSIFANVEINKNSVFFRSNTANELTINSDKANYVKNNILNQLNSKYKELFLDGNTISTYAASIPLAAQNQLPVGTAEDKIFKPNIDELKSTGRFAIFDKNDHKHLKYAEFAQPFNYNTDLNIIELLYDTKAFKIIDGKLCSVITADQIMLPNDSIFPRHKNSGLPPKEYSNKDPLTKVLADLWYEKADLDANGKIPLQELPDAVAYGGLLYVGNWQFEDNEGKYPKFSDANYQNHSGDQEVEKLQKGWFFIVAPANDSSDTDNENDTPVNEQKAKDGQIYTAGDWIIYVGNGEDDEYNVNHSWEKVDRAYSDPTYSPLPAKANIKGQDNNWWYWKQKRGTGALDLSGNTIIEAFKKINDQLKKLEPKMPAKVSDVKLKLAKDYPQTGYRKIQNNFLSEVQYAYDPSRGNITAYEIETQYDGKRTYKDLIYFGDYANVTVTLDGAATEFSIKHDSSEQVDGNIIISAPQETMKTADHGENFWKGFYVKVVNDKINNAEHTVSVAVDQIKLLYDKDPATDLHMGFGGNTSLTYEVFTPYFPNEIKHTIDYNPEFYSNAWVSLMNAQECSGILGFDLYDVSSIKGFECSLLNIYFDGRVPAHNLCDMKVLLNESEVFCQQINVDKYISFEKTTDTLGGYVNLKLSNVELPITYKKDVILPETTTFDFYVILYDFYGVPHEKKIYTVKGFRVDKTLETERCTEGVITSNSPYNSVATSFGKQYDSTQPSTTSLAKIGKDIDGNIIGIYQQPAGIYNAFNFSALWVGQTVVNELEGVEAGQYGVACFKIGSIKEASGFTFEIVTDDAYDFNKLTGATKDVILQACVVKPELPDPKVTAWLDCNRPYDGFSKINVKEFASPVMYAGNSNATVKRITFGRHQLLTGDVYVRVGIKKDSNLTFRQIKFIEEI